MIVASIVGWAVVGYPTDHNVWKPCGYNFLPGNQEYSGLLGADYDGSTDTSPWPSEYKWIRSGQPACHQRSDVRMIEDNEHRLSDATLYPFERNVDTDGMCVHPDHGILERTPNMDRLGPGCFGICDANPSQSAVGSRGFSRTRAEDPSKFQKAASQSCFFSTEPFDSMVVDGCGPGNHGSGYPIIGHKNAYDTPDDRFMFYGQTNARPDPHRASGKERELYSRIEPKTPPVSFETTTGPSAFILPDELFVSDNTRESNNNINNNNGGTGECEEHEQCVSNSPRANGLNKGEDLGHHRLYTFYFEGTTPTFDDEDLGLSNVVRSVPTCGARMVSRLSSGRGMNRGCADTPGYVSDFDVRTIAGDETVHAPVFSAYLSKKLGSPDFVNKSEFELAWTTLWGQVDDANERHLTEYDIHYMKKKLTAGPLPSAFFRQWCRSRSFGFSGAEQSFALDEGPNGEPRRAPWGTHNFDAAETLDRSPGSDAFEYACRWLDGSEDARRFGEQRLNATLFGKHYDRVIDLIKNEQRPFVKGTHGKILNDPSSERLYSFKGANVTLLELMGEVSGKTCGWFREYYCYEPHFTEERAQDEHSEKSLFDFYGPGRHWCVWCFFGQSLSFRHFFVLGCSCNVFLLKESERMKPDKRLVGQ